MDNSKRNVHNSGPLGKLVQSGQIKKVDYKDKPNKDTINHTGIEGLKAAGNYFKTQSGIKFSENELTFVDPKECEPWEYANRSENEMGDMDELVASIRENGQLQPALIRTHPTPHDSIKYQIIFGRRRYAACLKLDSSLLVIKKDSLSLQEAIACQDAENKFRKDVSNYSNALLYKKLLDNNEFKTERELAKSIGMNTGSLSELMSFAKIPQEIVNKIPDIHQLSVSLACKIARLLASDENNYNVLLSIAPKIGKSIKSPSKLEQALFVNNSDSHVPYGTINVKDSNNKDLFSFKINTKGNPVMTFQKRLLDKVDFEKLSQEVGEIIDNHIRSS